MEKPPISTTLLYNLYMSTASPPTTGTFFIGVLPEEYSADLTHLSKDKSSAMVLTHFVHEMCTAEQETHSVSLMCLFVQYKPSICDATLSTLKN